MCERCKTLAEKAHPPQLLCNSYTAIIALWKANTMNEQKRINKQMQKQKAISPSESRSGLCSHAIKTLDGRQLPSELKQLLERAAKGGSPFMEKLEKAS